MVLSFYFLNLPLHTGFCFVLHHERVPFLKWMICVWLLTLFYKVCFEWSKNREAKPAPFSHLKDLPLIIYNIIPTQMHESLHVECNALLHIIGIRLNCNNSFIHSFNKYLLTVSLLKSIFLDVGDTKNVVLYSSGGRGRKGTQP